MNAKYNKQCRAQLLVIINRINRSDAILSFIRFVGTSLNVIGLYMNQYNRCRCVFEDGNGGLCSDLVLKIVKKVNLRKWQDNTIIFRIKARL